MTDVINVDANCRRVSRAAADGESQKGQEYSSPRITPEASVPMPDPATLQQNANSSLRVQQLQSLQLRIDHSWFPKNQVTQQMSSMNSTVMQLVGMGIKAFNDVLKELGLKGRDATDFKAYLKKKIGSEKPHNEISDPKVLRAHIRNWAAETGYVIEEPEEAPTQDYEPVVALSGKYIEFQLDSVKRQGSVVVNKDKSISIGGYKLSKGALDGKRFQLIGETEPPEEEEEISALEKHHGDFEENFHNGSSVETGRRAAVSKISATTKGVGENFTCDQFARHLQAQLDETGIPYRSMLIAVDMGTDPRSSSSITLNEADHEFHQEQVGNDSHFVTTIEDGGIWVFDNHHPNGILLSDFLSGLEFKANIHGTGKISHAELINKGLIHVYLMPASDASKAGGWLKALTEKDPKFAKYHGIFLKEFIEKYKTIEPSSIKKIIQSTKNWKSDKIPKDGRYTASQLSDQQIITMVDQALISGRRWAVDLALKNDLDGPTIVAIARKHDMILEVVKGVVIYRLRGG